MLVAITKEPPRGVPRNRCSENMQQICRRHPCCSVISINLQSNFIEITLRHGCSPGNLLCIFRRSFTKNTSGWLLVVVSLCLLSVCGIYLHFSERKDLIIPQWHFFLRGLLLLRNTFSSTISCI